MIPRAALGLGKIKTFGEAELTYPAAALVLNSARSPLKEDEHNVSRFQRKSTSFEQPQRCLPPGRVEEARELIGRYPNLSEIELARLINLYREFSALDVALIISDEQLGPKLDLFFADHRSKVRVPFASMPGSLATLYSRSRPSLGR